jgi:DNA-binding NarL/FixJ family response regulator
MINVIIADHQPIFRAGMVKLLAVEDDIHIIALPDSADHLLNAIDRFRTHVVIVSSGFFPLATELQSFIKITKQRQIALLVLFNKSENPADFVSLGAPGALHRSVGAARLIEGVRRLGRGKSDIEGQVIEYVEYVGEDLIGQRVTSQLSRRELRIIAGVVQGYKYREIAAQFGTSEQMIKNAMRVIYDKTGVSDRLEMALFVIHHRALAQATAKVAQGWPGIRARAAA